ncbi:hypothetical protein ACH3XW_29600 [Acanthocheilonema viteae]
MQKTQMKTWRETFYRANFNSLIKLQNDSGKDGSVFLQVYINRDLAIKQLHYCRHSSTALTFTRNFVRN